MLKEYDDVMWQAVEDTLEEMYHYAFPSISWKQRVQDKKDGKDVDMDLIHHHYLPNELYKSILEMAKHNYSYEPFFQDYTEHLTQYLLEGGYGKDPDNPGKDSNKQHPSIKEEIGEEAFEILKKRLKAYSDFYRFDHRRWKFDFTVMNYSPNSNRQAVIDYWKSQGVELEIPSDKAIINHYWDGEWEDETLNQTDILND